MTQAYYYSSVAGDYTLTIAVTGSATILNVNSTTGLPSSLPFKLVLEKGTVREEIVKVTSVGGLALTVVRGWDGTPATSHDAGTTVNHAISAEDLTLARQHEGATSGVHGVTGNVVGTTDAQVLTNKTVSPATPSAVAAVVKGLSGQSGDLIEFQDYLGNTLAKVDSAGNVTAPNMTAKFAALDALDSTHTSNIATNAANIASNDADIAANAAAITALQTTTVEGQVRYGRLAVVSNSVSGTNNMDITGAIAIPSQTWDRVVQISGYATCVMTGSGVSSPAIRIRDGLTTRERAALASAPNGGGIGSVNGLFLLPAGTAASLKLNIDVPAGWSAQSFAGEGALSVITYKAYAAL